MSRIFGKALHAAFVVPDIDKEIERVLALGMGPVFVMRRIRVAARYRGERHDPLITAAFVYSGTMQLEFLQQHDDTPSASIEFLARKPEGGLQHFAYFSDDFDATLQEASAKGQHFDVVQEYIFEDGTPYEIYIEPSNAPGSLLIQLVKHGPLEAMYNKMQEICASWDGTDPVRNAVDLLPKDMQPASEALATAE
jgi:catechol 2,3-dioxygenase-like lactoylglutathione lyase family enzyme